MTDVLTIENLRAYYVTDLFGTTREVRAVDDVSLRVRRNEVYGIAGESSSGKSSLIKTLAGAIRPPLRVMGGSVTFDFGGRKIDVYADPAASQRDYDGFYCEWSKYDDSSTATGSGVSSHDAARLAITAADIARILPSRAATILDAGCATGGLLTALQNQGFTAVVGLDPSPRCAAACREPCCC